MLLFRQLARRATFTTHIRAAHTAARRHIRTYIQHKHARIPTQTHYSYMHTRPLFAFRNNRTTNAIMCGSSMRWYSEKPSSSTRTSQQVPQTNPHTQRTRMHTQTHEIPQSSSHVLKRTMMPSSDVLVDSFMRHHNYLRISLTDRCNLRCQVLKYYKLCLRVFSVVPPWNNLSPHMQLLVYVCVCMCVCVCVFSIACQMKV